MFLYPGMALVAAATLSLELALVRLLSAITWYHLAFFVLSTAMLGMTAGAVRVYLTPAPFRPAEAEAEASRAAFMLGVSAPIMLVLLCRLPLNVSWTSTSIAALAVATGASVLPFYFSGIAVTTLLTRARRPIGPLYGADLAGASAGCFLSLPALNALGAPATILATSAAALTASLALWPRKHTGRTRVTLGLMILLAVTAGVDGLRGVGIRPAYSRGNHITRDDWLLERWNAIARVVVFPERLEPPVYWGPGSRALSSPVKQVRMVIDGRAGTVMHRMTSDRDVAFLRYDVTQVVHALERRGPFCVVGVGGGRDIQAALLCHHDRVVGLEVNSIFVELLSTTLRDIAGILPNRRVRLVVTDGRRFLSRATTRFAGIQMSLLDTWAATVAGAYSMVENSLYTDQAWRMLLDRLTPTGVLSISRWYQPSSPGETGRVLSLAIHTLLERGVRRPEAHVAILAAGDVATVLVSPSPFSAQDAARLHDAATRYGFRAVHIPGRLPAWTTPEGHGAIAQMLRSRSISDLVRACRDPLLDYSPPTDDRPYFFHMLRPRAVHEALEATSGVVRGNLHATVVLLGTLAAMTLMWLLTVLVPLCVASRTAHRSAPPAPPVSPPAGSGATPGLLFFGAVGAGFMLTEMALLQRATGILGEPTWAMALVLGTLTAASGHGSMLSSRIPARKPALVAAGIIAAATVASIGVLTGRVGEAFRQAPWPWAESGMVALVAVTGLPLGLLVPLGLRRFRATRQDDLPWYWGVNGAAGVLGSVLAVVVSVHVGMSAVFMLAAGCYLVSAVSALLVHGRTGQALEKRSVAVLVPRGGRTGDATRADQDLERR